MPVVIGLAVVGGLTLLALTITGLVVVIDRL